MIFLFDENFPQAARQTLEVAGHKVFDLRTIEARGVPDTVVCTCAQKLRAVLLKTDKDFFHTVPFLYPEHQGVVVFSLRQPNRNAILARLSWFIGHMPAVMKNKVYLLRDRTYVTASSRHGH